MIVIRNELDYLDSTSVTNSHDRTNQRLLQKITRINKMSSVLVRAIETSIILSNNR